VIIEKSVDDHLSPLKRYKEAVTAIAVAASLFAKYLPSPSQELSYISRYSAAAFSNGE
jgi:hypothetical protein